MENSKEISVCFTGHRKIKNEDLPALVRRLDVLIDRCADAGCTNFIAGGAVGFDTLAAKRVIEARRRRPEITLELILPCRDQTSRWKSLSDINTYRDLKGEADRVEYLQIFYDSDCMMKRNRKMVDSSSVCIAYFNGKSGGTANTVDYARRQGLKVINLYLDKEK